MDKVYFLPGDVVELKQDLLFKPRMVVIKKEVSLFKNAQEEGSLKGIRCMWYTADLQYQEAIFSTKDLRLVEETNKK